MRITRIFCQLVAYRLGVYSAHLVMGCSLLVVGENSPFCVFLFLLLLLSAVFLLCCLLVLSFLLQEKKELAK